MRIIYYSHTFFSDCDFPLIRELECLGHEVFVYYHLSHWELNAGLIEIPKQPSCDSIICAANIKSLQQYKGFVNLNHVFFISNSHCRRFHPQKYLVWFKMFLHMRRLNADVVQITYHLQGMEKLIFHLDIPVVMTVHDPFLHSSKYSEKIERYRIQTFSKSSRLILLNNEMKDDFINHYKISHTKVSVSKLGEYSHIRLLESEKCPFTDNPFILFFGYISKYKGVRFLVEAMERIHGKYPNIDLVIVGRGKLDFDISQYEKNGYLKFINRFATVKELASLLQNCMFAVCPYTDATQSGVVQTAFSAGCPLIVTNVGNLPRAVTNEENGLVVEPSNSVDLADAMDRLLQNPKQLDFFRENIKEVWQKNMSWNTIAQDYLNTYNEILKTQKNK